MKTRDFKDWLARVKIRTEIFFCTDEIKKQNLWISYALYTKEGRAKLAEAMIKPLQIKMFH